MFYDLGPNENYQESLNALHVVPRMPAGALFSTQKHRSHPIKKVKQLKKPSTIYNKSKKS